MKRKHSSSFYSKVNQLTNELVNQAGVLDNGNFVSLDNASSEQENNGTKATNVELKTRKTPLDELFAEDSADSNHSAFDESTEIDLPLLIDGEPSLKTQLSNAGTNIIDSFRDSLSSWAVKHRITHSALGDLLHLMRKLPLNLNLPSDGRTLLSTPRYTQIRKVDPGSYSHVGLEKAVLKLCHKINVPQYIELLVNVDGLPLSESSSSQVYPILCSIFGHSENVGLIGIYHGYEKPHSANDFLSDFVREAIELTNNGLVYNNCAIPFRIKGFICDAPAKAFISYTKGHTGYYSCTKCVQKGCHIRGRTCFPRIKCTKRSDSDFVRKRQPQHHTGTSLLETIPGLRMVTGFPLEYMHLICLGVVKKLLVLWMFGKPLHKLRPNIIQNISQLHLSLSNHVPLEFVRKTRSLAEMKQWKATEHRFFLLYSGPVVLKQFLPDNKYKNFLCLHAAISILISDRHRDHKEHMFEFADSLLQYFVQDFGKIYGYEYISHNIHGLEHVADDVKEFHCPDKYSAFCYENYLQHLKKMLRKSEKPLAQIVRRLEEIDNLVEGNIKTDTFCCFGEHNRGPVLSDFPTQYSVMRFKSFIFKINKTGNNFCLCDENSVVLILNIVQRQNEVSVIGKKFLRKGDYYTYPCESSHLGIYFVTELSDMFSVSVSSIKNKMIGFPEGDGYVVFPLLHE